MLSGYYGCGNAGDEAVLAGIRDGFQSRAGDRVALTALSQAPDDTRAMHGIDSAYRMDIHALRDTIGRSDLLISGGGSLLQDTTSFKSLLYYLFVMRIAASRRVPFMLYAQGIGPLHRGISRKIVKMSLNHAAYITVRDMGSAELLKEIGVSTPRIEVTADPAFALNPADGSMVERALVQEGIEVNRDVIGVALRPWGEAAEAERAVEKYRSLLSELESSTGCRAVLLPMHHPDDLEFAHRIANDGQWPILKNVYPPDVVLGLVSRMAAVVAMRLHTLIFAARTGVPPFALAYDPKVRQLMKGLELMDSTVDWLDFDAADVAARVAATLSRRDAAVAALQIRSREREQAALRNCDVALTLLGRA